MMTLKGFGKHRLFVALILVGCLGILSQSQGAAANAQTEALTANPSTRIHATASENVGGTSPSAFCDGVTQIPKVECQALVALYNSTNGPGWRANSGWLANNTPCSWYGVFCGGPNVVTLELEHNQLSGTIPPELGRLAFHTDLDLSHNQLSGPIPPELGDLGALGSLDLSFNMLSGRIPSELGNLSNLGLLGYCWKIRVCTLTSESCRRQGGEPGASCACA